MYSYKVYYKADGENRYSRQSFASYKTSGELRGLKKWTRYEIMMATHNNIGQSRFGNKIIQKTDEDGEVFMISLLFLL